MRYIHEILEILGYLCSCRDGFVCACACVRVRACVVVVVFVVNVVIVVVVGAIFKCYYSHDGIKCFDQLNIWDTWEIRDINVDVRTEK